MGTIVAIGGGEIGQWETLSIDHAIVKLAEKDHPKVLFIPTASGDSPGYTETFQKVYGKKLGCDIDSLYLLKEKISKKEIEKKVLSADIIYVGGGNTLRMMKSWRKNGVDVLLQKAYKKGIILTGLSAGSICWFRYGSSDSRSFSNPNDISFMRVCGLGIIPLTVSPHHIREKKLRDAGLVKLMKKTPGIGLALDDYSAILIQDDRYEILKSKKNVGIVKVFRNKGKIERIPLKSSGTLVELLEKKI